MSKVCEGTKQFVRNAAVVPVPVTVHEYAEDEESENENVESVSPPPGPEIPDLSEPKLFSTLKYQRAFEERVKRANREACRTVKVNQKNAPPPAKEAKAVRVNLPFDEQLYRGLVELQVSDEHIGIDPNVPKKAKEFTKNKEEEPNLSDYYKPVFDKEYIIKPNPPVFELKKHLYFTGSTVLNITKRWNPHQSIY